MESQLEPCEHGFAPADECGSCAASRLWGADGPPDLEPELGVSLTDHTIERLIEQVNTTIGYLRGMSENGASFLPPHTRQGMIDRAENLCNAVDAVRGKR